MRSKLFDTWIILLPTKVSIKTICVSKLLQREKRQIKFTWLAPTFISKNPYEYLGHLQEPSCYFLKEFNFLYKQVQFANKNVRQSVCSLNSSRAVPSIFFFSLKYGNSHCFHQFYLLIFNMSVNRSGSYMRPHILNRNCLLTLTLPSTT